MIVTALPSCSVAPCVGEVIVEVGGVVSVDLVPGDQAGGQRPGLDTHFGEQVDRRLLHVGVWRRFAGLGDSAIPRR